MLDAASGTLCRVERPYVVGCRLGLRTNRGSNLWSKAMMEDIGDLDKIGEALVTFDLSDEALEAAAALTAG